MADLDLVEMQNEPIDKIKADLIPRFLTLAYPVEAMQPLPRRSRLDVGATMMA